MSRTLPRLRSPSPFAALLVVLLALVACGPPPPPRAPLRELPVPASALLVNVPTQYAPKGPIALIDDQGSAAALASFTTQMGGAAVHEAALDLVAAVTGKSFAEAQEMPADALMQWLYWKCGATSIPGPVNVLVAPAGSEAYFAQQLTQIAANLPRDGSVAYGVARVAVDGYVVQAVALGIHATDVVSVAKSQAPGQRVPLRIKPRKRYTNLKLYVDQGGADVIEQPMTAEADGWFSGEAPLPTTPGRYFAEVVGVELPPDGAADKGWRMSLLWVPFHVGVPEPAAPDDFIRHPTRNHPDRATWPVQVLNAYNEARARLGRPALAFEAAPSNLAQTRSEEIARFADLPPPDLELHRKLASAGAPARNLFGFVDEIEFVSEYITLRLQRPAARFAIFNPAVTTFALGLTPRKVAPGIGLVNSVEYVFEHIRVEPEKERERVLGELDAAQVAAGEKAFVHDAPLSRAAQSLAEEVCKGGPEPTDAKAMFARAVGLDPSLHRRFAVPWMGYDLSKKEIAQVFDAAKGKGFTHAGVGVCQGTMEGRPGVVLMMTLFAGP